MNANFKLAETNDTETLIPFMRALYEHEHIPFDENRHRAALSQILDDEKCGRVWLIGCEAETVGYVVVCFGFSLEFGGRDALIDELFVREEWRGRGVGRQALELVAAECRARGIAAVHLEVERANTDAQTVYRRSGFEDHNRYLMTRWLRDG